MTYQKWDKMNRKTGLEPKKKPGATEEKRGRGRPSGYDPKKIDIFLDSIVSGDKIEDAANSAGFTMKMFYRWFVKHDDFRQKYTEALKSRTVSDEISLLNDCEYAERDVKESDPKIANALANIHRLKIDTKKWLMSKRFPKKYGDKMDVTSDGEKLPLITFTFASPEQATKIDKVANDLNAN